MIPHVLFDEVKIMDDRRLMEADEHRLARLAREGSIPHRRGWHVLVAPLPASELAGAGNRARRSGAC